MTDTIQHPTPSKDEPAASRREFVPSAAVIAALAGASSTADAQGAPPANVQFINPPTMANPPGYTHVIEVTGPGHTVYIAGQLGLDPTGKLAGDPGDFRAQATQAFENLKSALASVGGTFDHVVKLNNYLTDITAHIPIYREVRDAYVNKANPPASTTVQVPKLARDGL